MTDEQIAEAMGWDVRSLRSSTISLAYRVCELVAAAEAAERERWLQPAFLWPVCMPDEVALWISANPPEVVPRDQMQRVEWPADKLGPNVRAKRGGTYP